MQSWKKVRIFRDLSLQDSEQALSSQELIYVQKVIPLTQSLEMQWDKESKEADRKSNLLSRVELHSASQVTYKQFLLFRTVLPSIAPPQQLNTQALDIAPLMVQANLILSDMRFSNYISDLITRQTQPAWNPPWGGSDGLFRVPVIQQQQVIRDEAQNGSVHSTAEASVNTSFILFLQAIADLVPQSGRQWTVDRSKLTADFSTRRRKRQFVAHTDGQLEDTFSSRILALVECKRSRREKHSSTVDMAPGTSRRQ